MGAIRNAAVTLAGIVVGLAAFCAFVAAIGQSPVDVVEVIFEGGFASAFSWQNTLLRSAPLILTGLAVALPAQAGMTMIGGEGTLALGGLAAAAAIAGVRGVPPLVAIPLALGCGALVGAAWTGLASWLKAVRGVNETISSLLLSYIGIAIFNHVVEGPLRDPSSLNKPSTYPVGDAYAIGAIPGLEVHWGLVVGIGLAFAFQVVVSHSTLGFAMRVAGGNLRAARLVGLPVAALLTAAGALGGSAAGLAGAIEVLAVHSTANASILAGYGYTGILVAFMARQQPLALVPVAILMGGISAAGSLLQRRLDLPDATTLVLQGLMFLSILSLESLGDARVAAWVKRHLRAPATAPAVGTEAAT